MQKCALVYLFLLQLNIGYAQNCEKFPKIIFDASSSNLREIDTIFKVSKEVTHIYLQMNNIQDIEGICKIRSIKVLSLAMNEIKEIPSCFGLLICLEELYLSGNKSLMGTENRLTSCSSLRILEMDHCGLTDMSIDFQEIKMLDYINLSYNSILFIPNSLKNHENIRKVRLGNNNIKSIPNWFFTLNNLEYVDLSYNNIEYIDPELFSNTNVRFVKLTGNNISLFNRMEIEDRYADKIEFRW